MNDTAILWFRRDLRLRDNPALAAAAKHAQVLPIFIWAPEEENPWQPGERSRQRLSASLQHLDRHLPLKFFKGPTAQVFTRLLKEIKPAAVYWNDLTEPHLRKRDNAIKLLLANNNTPFEHFHSHLHFRPDEVLNNSGNPYQVFTAFWNKCKTKLIPVPLPKPRIKFTPILSRSIPLDSLKISSEPFTYPAGEAATLSKLNTFLQTNLADYHTQRDFPAGGATSELSAALHFGELTPGQIFYAANAHPPSLSRDTFLKELGWREFSHYLLHHFPHTASEPLRPEFKNFPWRKSPQFLEAWKTGQTGYPIVDAAMRQLAATGQMHNRLRMIVASFLVKDLLLDWREGARWFWENLLDADLAQNTLGWQWTAGCGADAAPFFRIFNPATQSKKFDPEGTYIRQWIPELASIPAKYIHEPHKAPASERPANYPEPIISHTIAREIALEKFQQIRQ